MDPLVQKRKRAKRQSKIKVDGERDVIEGELCVREHGSSQPLNQPWP